jgi:peptide/nickel transport system substrate-binding protein
MSNPETNPTSGLSTSGEGAPQEKVSRRRFIKYAGAGVVGLALVAGGTYYYLNYGAQTPKSDTVVIAWSDQILSLHPYLLNLNASEESPLDAIYDRYIRQDKNLVYGPGVVTSWDWSSDHTMLNLACRSDVKFHNGDKLTSNDVAFSLQTAGDKKFAYGGVWQNIISIDLPTNTSLTLHVARYDPAFPDWLGFFDAFIIPKNYYSQVGQDAFAKSPVGSGPYKLISNSGGLLKLEAFPDYWSGPAPIKNVIFKQVLDPSARASEIQSGTSDFTLQVDTSVYSQLAGTKGLAGQKPFTTDVVNWFVAPYFEPFKDLGVRQAVHYALDKNSIVNNVLQGFGRPLSMPECPGYLSYDSSYNFPYDPDKAKSLLATAGYSASKPLNLTVGTTKGTITKDYEVAQACVQMWQNVGINVTLNVITLDQFFSARSFDGTLNALTLDIWSNQTGDPENDVGYMTWPSSPFSAWAGLKAKGKTDYTGLMDQANAMISPIFTGSDQKARIQAGTAAAKWVSEQGLIIPLYQQAQPLVMKSNLSYEPWPQSWPRPGPAVARARARPGSPERGARRSPSSGSARR